jgi:hypothetical protein
VSAARTVAACVALTLAWVATLTLHPWSDESVGDLDTRSSYAARLLEGELPYRDFAFEYPPLAAPVIGLGGLAGTSEDAYRLGIATVTLAAGLAILLLVRALARLTGGSGGWAAAGIVAAPLLVGAVLRLHFDLVAVALALGGVLAVARRRPALGLALLGAGAMTKALPLAIAPVALAWLWGSGDRRAVLRGTVALAATLSALGAAALALSPKGALDALAYQVDRPVQVESAAASVLWAADGLGLESPATVDSRGSVALEHQLASGVEIAFFVALVATLAALAFFATRRVGGGGQGAVRALVLASLAAPLACVALGPVLSPQFLAWAVPLLAMALAWRMPALAAATAAACVLTLVEFPARYFDLVAGEPVAVAITGARNAALLAAVALALRALALGSQSGAPAWAARTFRLSDSPSAS